MSKALKTKNKEEFLEEVIKWSGYYCRHYPEVRWWTKRDAIVFYDKVVRSEL